MLTNDMLLFVRIPQIQGIMGKRMPSSTESNIYWTQQSTGFNPQHPLQVLFRLHRSVPKQPNRSCQMRCWERHSCSAQDFARMKNMLKSLCWHLSNKSSLYTGPAQTCTFITPCSSGVLPKTLIISVLHEGYSDCFIIIVAADLINGRRVTVLSYSRKLLYLRSVQTFSLLSSCRDKQWKVVVNWLNLK